MKTILSKTYFLIMLACLCHTACNSDEGKIEGKWVLSKSSDNAVNDPNNYIILNADGSAIENNGSGENRRTWTIQEGELCIRALDSDGGIETCGDYELKGDVLIVDLSALGVKMEYHRR